MHYQAFKKFTLFLLTLTVLTGFSVSYSATTVAGACASVNLDNPSPIAIVCPFVRLLNIAVLSVGAVFLGMVVYGGIKLSLSLGDPKGYQGAQQTWFWAVVGLKVVLGFFTILVIVDNIFGLGLMTNGPIGIFDNLVTGISDLLTKVGIEP